MAGEKTADGRDAVSKIMTYPIPNEKSVLINTGMIF